MAAVTKRKNKTGQPANSSVAAPGNRENANALHPTLQFIADRADVSVTTVSRILSGQTLRYRISQKTEALVRQVANEFNFAPNQLARGLRLKKTFTIGLVVPEISNPYFANITRQVIAKTRAMGYSVIVCDSEGSTELERESIQMLKSRNVEGILLCPVGQSADHLREFVQTKTPIVLFDRFFPDLPLPYVIFDNVAGARRATELLIANGHNKIACLQGLKETSHNKSRVQGYKEALANRGLPIDQSLILGDSFSEQSGYIETKLLLSTRPEVKAILALSDLNALGAIRALTEERRDIPEDISLISFDESPCWPYLATPMTCVSQGYSEMGDVSVKLLFDQIQTGSVANHRGILLPTTLIVRKSVKQIVTTLFDI